MNKYVVFLTVWMLTPATGESQRNMSFDEILHSALNRNRELQAAREALHQAEARLTQARLRPNPTLDVGGTTDALTSRDGDNNFSIAVSKPLELGGKRSKRIAVEELSLAVVTADIEDAERRLKGRLQTLWLQGIMQTAKLDMIDRMDRLNQQMSSVMEVRVRAGDASRLDSQLLTAQTNQTRVQRLAAANQLAETRLQVATLAGLQETDAVEFSSGMAAGDMPSSESSAVIQALQNRPDLKAARLREQLAEDGIALARSQAVPNLSVSLGYSRESNPTLAATNQQRTFESENLVQFGVSIPLPFSNREQGNVAEAASRRAQARLETAAMETNIRQEVILAYRRYDAAKRTLEVLRAGVLEPNLDSARIVQLAYRLGDMRLLDVIAQQRIVAEAETSVIDAQQEYDRAISELILATAK